MSVICPGGESITVSTTLGSGYDVEHERMMNFNPLKAACKFAIANPLFVMRDITGDGEPETFCNRGLDEIAKAMGYSGFHRLSANNQITLMRCSPDWTEDSMERAVAHALRGGLSVACLNDEPHGHVAVVYPSEMESSSTWGEDVAIVANVGKTNAIMRLSGAFRVEDRPSVSFFLHGDG